MTNPIEQFRGAIESAGLHPPEVVQPDGKLHRFATSGRPSDDAGWYVFHNDGIPAGVFGDWRTGTTGTWRADIGRRLSREEEAAHQARINRMRREREAEEARRQSEARATAARIWREAGAAQDDHPYLARKEVKAQPADFADAPHLAELQLAERSEGGGSASSF